MKMLLSKEEDVPVAMEPLYKLGLMMLLQQIRIQLNFLPIKNCQKNILEAQQKRLTSCVQFADLKIQHKRPYIIWFGKVYHVSDAARQCHIQKSLYIFF